MKKFFNLILLAGVFFFGCDKRDDFSGNGQIRGRLMYKDFYIGDGVAIPISGKKVKLAARGSDTLNFRYSAITDKEGYFNFSNLEDVKYDLFFRDTLGGVMLIAYESKSPSADSVFILKAVHDGKRQNGISFTVKDAQLNPVGNSEIWVFNNPLYAESGTSAGAAFILKTDVQGRAIKYGIPASNYWASLHTTINSKSYIGDVSGPVGSAGVTSLDLNLSINTEKKTGFEIQVVDQNGQPLNNIQICVFNNKILSETNDCVGSIFQLSADVNGKAVSYGQEPNMYFFKASGKYGDLELIGEAEVRVEKDLVKSVVIQMQKK